MADTFAKPRYNNGMNDLSVSIIGKPEKWLIEAAETMGLDISGLTHEITNYFVSHCIKKHGNAETEKAQGQVPIDPVILALYLILQKNQIAQSSA